MAAAVALAFAAAVSCLVTPAAADSNGSAHGQVLNMEGKPWANLTVVFVSSQGQQTEVKTDKNGHFSVHGLAPGEYSVRFTIPGMAAPLESKATIKSGEDVPLDFNFKEQAGAITAGQKKQEEETKKFESLKASFTAGKNLLEQASQVQAELATAPADQHDALKQKVSDLSAQAAAQFEAGRQAASEKDPNLPILWANLASAYDLGGRNEDAVKAYQQAIALKPDVATYYNNLGNLLARQGKTEEAGKMYAKCAELDPPNAATAWRNFGIVLYNAQRMKEAVEPLRKSAELDPKSAKTWYLLGSSLVNLIEYKQEGDKMVLNVPPGTVEAFQKAIELDPDGPLGTLSKQALDGLRQAAPGIDTSYGAKKRKL
jgi:tetratricopeptide (TPR) repeat protein